MRVYLAPGLGSVPLQRLRSAQLTQFYDDLNEGLPPARRPLSAQTVRHVHSTLRVSLNAHSTLRVSLNAAVRWGLLGTNPALHADIRPADRFEMATWRPSEVRKFLCSLVGDRDAALFTFLATTGVRRGEALGMRWQDLDLVAHRATVRQQLVEVGSSLVFGPPKTKRGARSIALDPVTVEALQEHRRAQLEERLAWSEAYHDHGLVFPRQDGSPRQPSSVSGRFKRLSVAAGLPSIRLHDLRHTHATLALSAGVPIKVVSDRLGHSTAVLTLDTYSHVTPDLAEDAARRVAGLIWG